MGAAVLDGRSLGPGALVGLPIVGWYWPHSAGRYLGFGRPFPGAHSASRSMNCFDSVWRDCLVLEERRFHRVRLTYTHFV